MSRLTSKEACSFVSKVEIATETNEGSLYFLLKGIREISYPYSLFQKTDTVDVFDSIPLQEPVNNEILGQYYEFLRIHYDAFYSDVND